VRRTGTSSASLGGVYVMSDKTTLNPRKLYNMTDEFYNPALLRKTD
jgi:hypothetical protein